LTVQKTTEISHKALTSSAVLALLPLLSFPEPIVWASTAVPSMTDVIIDLEQDATMVFDSREWIAQGKKYRDVPLYVCRAFLETQRLPEDVCTRFPHPDMPVSQFVNHVLPIQSAEAVPTDVDQWFNAQPPEVDMAVLFSSSIPPKGCLVALKNGIGQAWFDGLQSIRAVSPGLDIGPLPFWVLSYWKRMSQLIQTQKEWLGAISWYRRESGPTPSVELLFGSVGWNSDIPGHMYKTTYLPQILSNWRLCDVVMEMMVEHLRARLLQDPALAATTIILPAPFHQVFAVAANNDRYDEKTLPSTLRTLEVTIKQGGQRHVYLGVFVNGNHEIAAYLNFEKRTISYGEAKFCNTES
jgi:hypothetical protein